MSRWLPEAAIEAHLARMKTLGVVRTVRRPENESDRTIASKANSKKHVGRAGNPLIEPRSRPEEMLWLQIIAAKWLGWTREHRFYPARMWRFDFANVDLKIAVEVEGGIWVQGSHSRGKRFAADCEKYAKALILGWRVLRVVPKHVENGMALAWIQRLLER